MTLRRIDLDFIAAPRRLRWLGYALLAVSLAIAAHLVLRYGDARLSLEYVETGREMLNVERPQAPPISQEKLTEQTKNLELVMRQLALPWASLIRALEEAAGQDVAILQLQPEVQQRLIRITAEARHPQAMLEYMRQISAAKDLYNVHLISHQIQADDPQRPIQFSVQASLRVSP